jgi:hypothetical protein
VHPWSMRAEGEIVEFPSGRLEAWAHFDTFYMEENEHLFKALYFVTGNRHDAEELPDGQGGSPAAHPEPVQGDAEEVRGGILDPVDLVPLFPQPQERFLHELAPAPENRDEFLDAEMRADVRQLLLGITPRQRAALLLVDLLGYSSEQAARILRVRPSTVRALATKGRRALRQMEGARDA